MTELSIIQMKNMYLLEERYNGTTERILRIHQL